MTSDRSNSLLRNKHLVVASHTTGSDFSSAKQDGNYHDGCILHPVLQTTILTMFKGVEQSAAIQQTK